MSNMMTIVDFTVLYNQNLLREQNLDVLTPKINKYVTNSNEYLHNWMEGIVS